MDERVENDENPDWRRTVSNTGPHTHHSPGMVVALQQGRRSALQQDDNSVQDLVELRDVEPESEHEQAVIWGSNGAEHSVIQVTHRLEKLLETARVGKWLQSLDILVDGAAHADKSPHRVPAQEDVVQEHKQLEQSVLRYSVWSCR